MSGYSNIGKWNRVRWALGDATRLTSVPVSPRGERDAPTVYNTNELADFIWYLLPAFLKRKEREASRLGSLVSVLGAQMDDVRQLMATIPPLWLVDTSFGAALDHLGGTRELPRLTNESDEPYRRRLLKALDTHRLGGTLRGLEESLAEIGVEARVWELRVKGRRLFPPALDASVAEREAFRRERYLVLHGATDVWDDWSAPAERTSVATFDDGGVLDGLGGFSGNGEWKDHLGSLAMWLGRQWVFLPPRAGLSVWDEESQTHWRYDGHAWATRDEPYPWAHFVLEIRTTTYAELPVQFDETVRARKPAHALAWIYAPLDASGEVATAHVDGLIPDKDNHLPAAEVPEVTQYDDDTATPWDVYLQKTTAS